MPAGNRLQDVAEVFIQRALEIDSSGELGKRFEYFWESLGSGEKSFTDKILGLFPNAASLFSAMYTSLISTITQGWSYLLSNPPTGADYARHNNRLDQLQVEGQKLLLVAHSQGNLFVNQATDYIKPKIGENSIQVVHVAPASISLRGDWVLSSNDILINALRIQGISTIYGNNIDIPFSKVDITGHYFIETYLDNSRPGRDRVTKMMKTSLAALVTPTISGNVGAFTVTLTWDGTGDVDLHTFEPTGSHVFYASPGGNVGFLDVDNTIADGPEHYYASCDQNILQPGAYSIAINNYSRAIGRLATVQVATSREGVIFSKQLAVGAVMGGQGNINPLNVTTVNVNKDQTTGSFSFSAL